jgi:exodeoxyribonuclease VII small subunit
VDDNVVIRKKSINFEKNLDELEGLVEALESGGLSLEDSLKTFEKGVRITRECQEALKEAEQKVNLLTKGDNGAPVISDFSALDDEP